MDRDLPDMVVLVAVLNHDSGVKGMVSEPQGHMTYQWCLNHILSSDGYVHCLASQVFLGAAVSHVSEIKRLCAHADK